MNFTLVCEAGTTLSTAGSFQVVAPGGNVTFRAGERIVLGNGFSVETGTTFTVEIDPLLKPD